VKALESILERMFDTLAMPNVDYFPWIDNLFAVIFAMCRLLLSLPKKISLQTFVQRENP
jgi:hypothetical protein